MRYTYLPIAALAGLAYSQSLTELLSSTDELSSLADLIGDAPEIAASLGNATNITLLAPSNSAIEELLSGPSAGAIASTPGLVQAVLQYHVLAGVFEAADIPEEGVIVPTLLTNETYTSLPDGQVVLAASTDDSVVFSSGLLANSTVTTADIEFDGGVVHIIDEVLTIPENVTSTLLAAELDELAGAITEAGLEETVDSLEEVTIFAPSNEAFEAISDTVADLSEEELGEILQYHIIEGTVGYSTILEDGAEFDTVQGESVRITIEDGNIFVNDAQVIIADVLIASGVVHVIDGVLNPEEADATPTGGADDDDDDDDDDDEDEDDGVVIVGDDDDDDDVDVDDVDDVDDDLDEGDGDGDIDAGDDGAEENVNGAVSGKTGAIGAAAILGAGIALFNL